MYDIFAKTKDASFAGKLNDYLGRMDKLNKASLDFIQYVKNRKRPTLFSFFGDYQADVG